METNQTRLKEVLAIVNNKGGVGKTTTVQSLAVAMKREHKDWHILVIDLDPQGDLTKLVRGSMMSYAGSVTEAMTSDNGRLTVYKGHNGIYYVPSSPELQKIEPKLMEQMQPYMVLRRLLLSEFADNTPEGIKTFEQDGIKPVLSTIPELFDYVLIDCPPALSMCTYNAMAVASGLLIPVQMEGLSVSGLAPVIVEMERVKRELNPQLELRGILPVMVDARPNISKSFIAYLEQAYGDNVTTTIIPRSVRVNEAQTKKQDIYEYKQWSPVANAYESLAKELFG
jgi:chromosome partitioning protein